MHRADALRRWSEFALPDGSMLDPTYPASDLDYLEARLARVKKWVNIAIAHHAGAKGEIETELKIRFEDLHAAIDVVVEMFGRYSNLLTHQYPWLEEVLTSPWDVAFTVPWIEDWYLRHPVVERTLPEDNQP